jgi:hypothetical protein
MLKKQLLGLAVTCRDRFRHSLIVSNHGSSATWSREKALNFIDIFCPHLPVGIVEYEEARN